MTTPARVVEVTPANTTHGRERWEAAMQPPRAPEVPQRASTLVIKARRLA